MLLWLIIFPLSSMKEDGGRRRGGGGGRERNERRDGPGYSESLTATE